MGTIRLIKHEVVPKCGSFEVRFADRTPSKVFYWDDVAGRRLRPAGPDDAFFPEPNDLHAV